MRGRFPDGGLGAIESPNDLFLTLEKYKVGDAVSVTSLRDGRTVQTKVTLDAVQ